MTINSKHEIKTKCPKLAQEIHQYLHKSTKECISTYNYLKWHMILIFGLTKQILFSLKIRTSQICVTVLFNSLKNIVSNNSSKIEREIKEVLFMFLINYEFQKMG